MLIGKRLLNRLTISQKVVLMTSLIAVFCGSIGGFFIVRQSINAVMEEKKFKLQAAARLLDIELRGSYDAILREKGKLNAPPGEQIRILEEYTQPLASKVAELYSRNGQKIRVGYYSKRLQAPITYSPREGMEGKIGKKLSTDHPGWRVFETGQPQVTSGLSNWGPTLSYRQPLFREGKLIGYVAVNEPLAQVLSEKNGLILNIALVIMAAILTSILGSYFISRQLMGDIVRIKNGVQALAYKLDKPMPEVYGELGEIAGSINQMAASLDTLQRSSRLLAASLDTQEICDRAVEMIMTILPAKYCNIVLLEQATNTLEIRSTSGLNPETVALVKLKPGEGLTGLAFTSKKPVLTFNMGDDPRTKYPLIARKLGVYSMLAAPILGKAEALGVIEVMMGNPYTFSQNEEELILSIGYQLGGAIENARLYEKAAHLAVTDSLTGLYNYHYFQESLAREIEEARRLKRHLSLVMLDIDNFKIYNDTFGHMAGDQVLEIFSGILQKNVRQGDVVARYGGEEFSIILVDSDAKLAVDLAENIRRDVESYPFYGREQQPGGKLTVSIGIASFPLNASSKEDLLNKADEALYKAKYADKNKVELYFSVLDEMKGDLDRSEQSLINTVKTLITVINAKDRYTYGHSERVVEYCQALGCRLGLSEEEGKNLRYAAFLHDIGKIEIDRDLLNKCGSLTRKEWGILKQHPKWGAEIIKPVKSLSQVLPIILHHHERYDGKGYPDKISGEEIPRLARILAVCDSFDAMTVMRGYQKARPFPDAVEELKKQSGSQFDPEIVQAFLEILPGL